MRFFIVSPIIEKLLSSKNEVITSNCAKEDCLESLNRELDQSFRKWSSGKYTGTLNGNAFKIETREMNSQTAAFGLIEETEKGARIKYRIGTGYFETVCNLVWFVMVSANLICWQLYYPNDQQGYTCLFIYAIYLFYMARMFAYLKNNPEKPAMVKLLKDVADGKITVE